MRRWTLVVAAIALAAAALWHLPAIAQHAPSAIAGPTPAAGATPPGADAAAAAKPAVPSAAPPAHAAGIAATPTAITFAEYRDFRMRYITQSQVRLTRELAASDLTAAQRASLERRKAYYDRQAAMSPAERDTLFRARFDQIDTDHDGTIDSAERAAWRQKQREHYRELAAERAQAAAVQH
ncbi:MAG TPA: EF-hand domain-containing protein [Stellaceae bacterium]|nr:EF-hand domain-containing protein [Stellaceae bacterium]